MSAYDLADRAKLTHPTIYSWLEERGKRPPARENVERVAAALGVTYGELWGEAPLGAGERTRLLQLESAVRQMRAILDQLEEADEIPSALSATEPRGFEEEETPAQRRRRSPPKGA